MVGHDVDTDQIHCGQYLPLSNSAEMAKHAMEHVPGLESFAQLVKEGDSDAVHTESTPCFVCNMPG